MTRRLRILDPNPPSIACRGEAGERVLQEFLVLVVLELVQVWVLVQLLVQELVLVRELVYVLVLMRELVLVKLLKQVQELVQVQV